MYVYTILFHRQGSRGSCDRDRLEKAKGANDSTFLVEPRGQVNHGSRIPVRKSAAWSESESKRSRQEEGVISLPTATASRRFSGQTGGTRREGRLGAGGIWNGGKARPAVRRPDPCAWTVPVAHLRLPTGKKGKKKSHRNASCPAPTRPCSEERARHGEPTVTDRPRPPGALLSVKPPGTEQRFQSRYDHGSWPGRWFLIVGPSDWQKAGA